MLTVLTSLYDDLPCPGLGGCKIVCTQPRRVAAMGVAKRVASELDTQLGEEVGYVFRNDDMTGPRTIISYTTDGHLLQKLKSDQGLRDYSCVLIDEAHERTVSTDFLIAKLKDVCKRRPDLKVVIMSATMDSQKFVEYYDGAPIHHIPGRIYPVEVNYLADDIFQDGERVPGTLPDYNVATVAVVMHIHKHEAPGDILVFLPGADDINTVVHDIAMATKAMLVFPLYASMSKASQQQALEPLAGEQKHLRKCVVATNIAETSLTIDGVVYVVVSYPPDLFFGSPVVNFPVQDCGLEKMMTYNPRLRAHILLVVPISQASADQRKGRAGRTKPGRCFRLYAKQMFHDALVKKALPKIQTCDMAGPILDLMTVQRDADVSEIITFPWIDPPTPEVM